MKPKIFVYASCPINQTPKIFSFYKMIVNIYCKYKLLGVFDKELGGLRGYFQNTARISFKHFLNNKIKYL